MSSSRRAHLSDWLQAVVETPGLTALRDPVEAWRVLVDDSLRALPLLAGLGDPIVDVGSGGGAPGIPLAFELPSREVVLLESQRRKCTFLTRWAPANTRVVCGRVEEQGTDWAGAVVAKALAPPPVAAEWCLPLARLGGGVVLFIGETANLEAVARVAAQVGGGELEDHDGLLLIPKVTPTPAGFPRRPGMARKRPLA
jgi:16S rRNA (guanine527-N7)-methyltransferase